PDTAGTGKIGGDESGFSAPRLRPGGIAGDLVVNDSIGLVRIEARRNDILLPSCKTSHFGFGSGTSNLFGLGSCSGIFLFEPRLQLDGIEILRRGRRGDARFRTGQWLAPGIAMEKCGFLTRAAPEAI